MDVAASEQPPPRDCSVAFGLVAAEVAAIDNSIELNFF
jgi:hypothetical protein